MHILLSEPVGGSSPKFSGESISSTVRKAANNPFSLSCPAQGSPVPSYRSVVQISLSEPVGGSLPKFSGEFDGFTMKKAATQPFSLSCPAQGSPVPAYRLVIAIVPFQNLSEGQLQNSVGS